jgi:serine protease Do
MNDYQKQSVTFVAIVALVAGLVGGGIGAWVFSPDMTVGNGNKVLRPVSMTLESEDSQVIDAIEEVSPAVVSIVVSKDLRVARQRGLSPFDLFFENDPFFDQFFGQRRQMIPKQDEKKDDEVKKQKVGGGTGFILNQEGIVLTNRHVVSDTDADFTVILNDGTEYEAKVVSRDVFNDLAVVQIVADDDVLEDLPTVRLGNSSDLKIGQTVIAIGNALGEFQNTATTGIISAKGRQITAGDGRGMSEQLTGLLQTDAAINPGNSGGPLINLAGEVIGVNTAIAQSANGIGFAIPIDDVKPIVESVEKHGKIVRPILGVMFTMLTEELAEELGFDIEEGALLRGDGKNFAVLEGKPADKAGLQEKDVIVEVNGEKVTVDDPLQNHIRQHSPGDSLTLKVWRKGKTFEVTVELAEADMD